MAMALGARPDDSAKMVWSRGCIAYLCKRLWKGNAISIWPTGWSGPRPSNGVGTVFAVHSTTLPDFVFRDKYYIFQILS